MAVIYVCVYIYSYTLEFSQFLLTKTTELLLICMQRAERLILAISRNIDLRTLVNNLPKSAMRMSIRGMPMMAYTMHRERPAVVTGVMCP